MYNELYHFGIKGMKWGIRRYQNEDGTWTDAGKARRKKNGLYSAADLKKIPHKKLNNMILKKSGDWYRKKAVSDGFKEAIEWAKKAEQNPVIVKAYNKSAQAYKSLQDYAKRHSVHDKKYERLREASEQADSEYFSLEKQVHNLYVNKLQTAVLNDLGVEDTAETREYIQSYLERMRT